MRLCRALLLVILITSGRWLDVPAARAVGVWDAVAPYPDAHVPAGGSVTLEIPGGGPDGLPGWQVLYAGFLPADGTNPARGSAARYNPATTSWQATAPFDFHQGYDTPVLLRGGRVLVVGGAANEGIFPGGRFNIRNVQIYDPIADSWSPAGAMSTARGNHTATSLLDGSVLVVGATTPPAMARPTRFPPSNVIFPTPGSGCPPRRSRRGGPFTPPAA